MVIHIDFVGGSHGHFLARMLNRHLAGIDVQGRLFNDLGASHDAEYQADPLFVCDHYTTSAHDLRGETLIIIEPGAPDLLPLQCVSLYRAGNFGLDPRLLHQDTWWKLDQPVYRSMRDTIYTAYYHGHQRQWGADYPDCLPWILRDFFRCGFLDPMNHGLVKPMINSHLPALNRTYHWPFGCFYHELEFFRELDRLAQWLDMRPRNLDLAKISHREFVSLQPYAGLQLRCDVIVNDILSGQHGPIDLDNVVAQAYIEASIQQRTGFDQWGENNSWWATMQQLKQHIDYHAS